MVPARGNAVVVFIVNVRRPGPFNYSTLLYLDDGALRAVEISIVGESLGPAG